MIGSRRERRLRVAPALLASTFVAAACGGRVAHEDGVPDQRDAASGFDGRRAILDGAQDARSGDGPSLDPDRDCVGSGVLSDVVGSVDGRPIQLTASGISEFGFPKVQSSWSLLRTGTADNAVLAWGVEIDGAPPKGSGGLVVPDDPPLGSVHYCASSAEAKLQAIDDGHHVVNIILDGLSELGRCPGLPVSGDLTFCQGDGSDSGPPGCASQRDVEVAGNIEGTPVDFGYLGRISSTEVENGRVHFVLGNAISTAIVVSTRADGTAVGWLKIPSGTSPMAGITYCLSNPTIRKFSAETFSITFTSIGRLGPCPGRPVQGRVGVCW